MGEGARDTVRKNICKNLYRTYIFKGFHACKFDKN